MKQHEAVIQTLEDLGGVATLGQLNQEVFRIQDCEWKTKTPFATIRRIVQTRPEIYKLRPGLYGLLKLRRANEEGGFYEENSNNKNSKEIIEFNHSYYQGLLIQLGNLKKFDTFIPHQDKNKKFLNQTLGSIRSLQNIPQYSYSSLVQRSATIDVIWFNNREMPHSFFEIEHSTDIQNSLLKFNDLQDFNVRMIIVADKSRREEFENKNRYSSFNEIKQRLGFLDYESLSRQYETMVELRNFELIL